MMNFIHKLILTSMVLSISLLLWPTDTVHAGNTKTAVTGQTLNLTYSSSGVTGNCNLTVPGGGGYTGTTIAGNSSGNYNPGNASVGGSFTLDCTPSGGGNINDTATLSILSCSPGDYINGSVCSPCVAGNYCPGGTASPVQCEFDFYCPAGASGHTACPAFYTSSPGSTKYGDCIPPSCAPGTYWNGSSCTTCTAGNYCPGDGSYYSCSYGYTSSPGATGSGQCVPRCSVGNYWNGSSCSTCPQGKTCDGTGTQTPCPAGKICPAGTGPGGGTDCTAGNFCPQGTTPGGGTQPPRACTELGAGYTSNAGAGSSAQCFLPTCQPGEYLNASSCTPCTPGYFCDGSGGRTPCPAGKICDTGTTQPGGTNPPQDCNQRYWCPGGNTPIGGTTPPTYCGDGYTSVAGSSNAGQCVPRCSQGDYWSGSACSQCPEGKICDGTTVQTPCTETYYCGLGTTPSNGTNPPVTCPPGKMCDAGTTSNSGGNRPADCSSNSWCPGGNSGPSGSNPPKNCTPSGYVTTGTPATSSGDCHAPPCTPGNYFDSGTGGCAVCTIGNICDGTSDPQPCTAGYTCDTGTTPSNGSNPPGDCPAGYYCDGGNNSKDFPGGTKNPTACAPLTSNKNSTQLSDCHPPTCPSGQYWDSTTSTCKDCTSGYYCSGSGSQDPCPPGFVCGPTTTQPGGTTPPKRCPAGSSCPGGNTDPADPGTNTNPPIICTANHYCPTGTGPTDPGTINPLPCPEGKWSTVGSSQLSDCQSSNPSGPDLTIDTIYPTTVTSGVMTTFYTTIENRGTTNTGASFYNLVYFADDINGGGNISTTTPYNGLYPAYYTGKMGILGVSEATTTSARHAFTAPGSVKFCTDKQNQNDATGLVNEGTGENNNCTGWINIAISGVSACVPGPGMYHNGTTCVACPPGNFCPGGTTPNPCPPNTYCDGTGPGGIGNTPPGGTYPPISCNGGFVSPQGSGSSGSCVSGGSPSGTLTSSSNSCTITTGQSTCDVTMSWSTNSPVGTTELIRDGQTVTPAIPDAVGNNVSNQLIHVPYDAGGTVGYGIYNGGGLPLAHISINVGCAGGANKYDTVSGTCVDPQVNSLLVRGNYYDDPGHIEFKCGGSDSYEVRMDPTGANTLVPGGSGVSTGDTQLHSVPVTTTKYYKVICKKGSIQDSITTSYTNPADRDPPTLSFTAVPKTVEVGGKVVLNWDITLPAPACVMTAQVVCPNGTCNQTLTSYQTELNAMIQSGRVDQVAGSQTTPRTIASSISTVTPGHETTDQKAIGKKTLSSVQGTTDFMIDCGGTKKASTRVRVTSSKEN